MGDRLTKTTRQEENAGKTARDTCSIEPRPPTILVCGGREFQDRDRVYNTLYDLCAARRWNYEPTEDGNYLPNVRIINGGAEGADAIATDWAIVNWCDFKEYRADWRQYGLSAGIRRNQQMLDEDSPDLVVAFKGGKGTADMVKRARAAGIEVIVVE